jgi:hypothetical protein
VAQVERGVRRFDADETHEVARLPRRARNGADPAAALEVLRLARAAPTIALQTALLPPALPSRHLDLIDDSFLFKFRMQLQSSREVRDQLI